MTNQYEHLLTAIDVGSAKTCVLVAEITDAGLRYRGHGVAESRGSRKGIIVDLDKAVASIQRAVEEAEDAAGAPIEHALLGVAGSHVRGVNSHGGVSFGTRPREITRDEIRQAVDKARAIALPADREILHLLPQEFILDDQAGVHDPLGMMATRLEVRVHMVTTVANATQNMVTAVNRAGVHVDDTVFEPLACADFVLVSLIPEANEVEIPSVGDRPSRLISQRMVGEILEPRARELFEMLRDNLRHSGTLDLCAGGVVLSGGASRLPGIEDVAESVLRRPVRLSWPTPLAKMPSTLAEPEYATALGMVFYGHRARLARGSHDGRWSSRLAALFVKKGA